MTDLARDARALADLETERAEQALEDLLETETYFNEIFSAAEVGELGTEVKVADVLARMTASLPTAFPDRPLARARLLQRVGRTFVALGEAEAGGEFLLEAHALLDAHGEQTPRKDEPSLLCLLALLICELRTYLFHLVRAACEGRLPGR